MYSVPYGKMSLEFDLLPGMRGEVVKSNPVEPLANVEQVIADALARPIGTPPLREMAGPGDSACIVFPDITRASPDHLLVPALLRELAAAGVRDRDITLLCGIGMHRPSTGEEKIAKLGADVVARYRVIDNEPQNPAALADMGLTSWRVVRDQMDGHAIVVLHRLHGLPINRQEQPIGRIPRQDSRANHKPVSKIEIYI